MNLNFGTVHCLDDFGDFLLDFGFQTFALKKSYFEYLGQKELSNLKIEKWVQIELIMSLLIRNIYFTTIGKGYKDYDLIIQHKTVKLRCTTTPLSKWLLDGIKNYSRVEYYFFLARIDSKSLSELSTYFHENNYTEKHKMLTDNWLVMIVQKEQVSSTTKEIVVKNDEIEKINPKSSAKNRILEQTKLKFNENLEQKDERIAPKKWSSPEAHRYRLTQLLNWAESDSNLQNAIKNNNNRKAKNILKKRSIELFGSYYARDYAKIIYSKLKNKNKKKGISITWKWGFS
jgi:hypothetical protein